MKKLFLLPVILLFTAATYGPPFSVSDFSSLTNRPNPSSVNPVGVVLGKTNAYDGNGGIFVFTPSSTNAVDGDIYLTTTTTGRWVRLTRDIATISSPLVLSNGTLSLAALTNYFTFLAGTNMQVTVTSNTVTYGMTNTTGGGSGNLITVNGGLVTNFWDNGYITFLNAGGGDYSLNIGDDTISTNKINSTFYNWVLSLSGGGGGTTNGLGVNGTFRTDWNAISSAEIAYTVSAGTNWYGSLVAGSVAANKLATTGTGTSTNFLAGDYSYKYVTTNMIPGLNAILATIGSGGGSGGGLGTNFVLNGVLLQPATITNGLSVIWSTNANGHAVAAVSLVDTNIPSTIARLDSPTFTGTVTFDTLVANTLQVPFASRYAAANSSSNLVATSDGASWTNLNGSSIATGTVADARIDSALARLASPTFTGDPKAPTASPGDNDTSIASTAFVTAAVAAGGGSGGGLGTNLFVNNILSQPAKLTNSTTIVWSTNSNGDIVATATNIAGTTTDNVLQWLGSAYFIVTNNSTIGDFSVLQTNGIVYNATVIGAGENDAPLVVELSFPTRSTNYIWTFRPEGDVNGFVAYEAEGYRTNTSIRFKLHEAVGSTFFTGGYWMRFDLYDKASVGGSGGSGSDTNWNGNPIASGTITNLTTTRINGVVPVQQEKGALFWDFVTAPPFMTALALSSGASFPTTGTTNDPFALIAQTGGSSANSGHGYYTGASSYDVAGGEEWEFGWYIHKTNNVGFRTGLLDVLSATAAATDGIYIEQQTNGTYRGVSVANASLSATASSYVPVEDSTIQYKGTWVVASNPTNVVFTIYTNGVSVWTDTVSANIPTNTARLTGLGFFSWHGGSGSGTNLIKYGWFSFKPTFNGSR